MKKTEDYLDIKVGWRQWLVIAMYLLLPTGALVGAAAVTLNLKDRGCKERWQGGAPARYVLGRGCLVEIKHGLWVPEKNAKLQVDR